MNWVSRFFPSSVKSYSLSEKVYLEFNVDQIYFDTDSNNARIDLNVFMLMVNNPAIVVQKFKITYQITFSINYEDGKLSPGIENKYNLEMKLFDDIGDRLAYNTKTISTFLHKIVGGSLILNKYVMFKNPENFSTLIQKFNEVISVPQGFILRTKPVQRSAPEPSPASLKFLF